MKFILIDHTYFLQCILVILFISLISRLGDLKRVRVLLLASYLLCMILILLPGLDC